MTYVEWVERVFERLAQAAANSEGYAGGGEIFLDGLPAELGVEGQEATEAARQAVDDLRALGWVEQPDNLSARLTQFGRQVASIGIRKSWPEIARAWLEPEQEEFLTMAVEMGERQKGGFAYIDHVDAGDVFEVLGWPEATHRVYGFTEPLEEGGFVGKRIATNAYVKVRPTYLGVVRATESAGIEGQELLQTLLAEGETTNLEIKRRLDLGSEDGKAKFIRHALALATTKSSGRRFLIVGFDDRTRGFVETPEPSITQERFEQLLHAYTDPTPDSAFRRVRVKDGEAVILELVREPTKIPYRVSKDIGGLSKGDVYVRHGSASEKPTERELRDLEAEGVSAQTGQRS